MTDKFGGVPIDADKFGGVAVENEAAQPELTIGRGASIAATEGNRFLADMVAAPFEAAAGFNEMTGINAAYEALTGDRANRKPLLGHRDARAFMDRTFGATEHDSNNRAERLIAAGGRGAMGAVALAPVAALAVPGAMTAPGMTAASGFTGGVGGQYGAEVANEASGGDPVVTALGGIAGGLVGGVAPGVVRNTPAMAAGGVRRILRGGSAGRQRLVQAIADFDRAGTSPTVAQGTQGTLAQYAEAALRYAPGAMGRVRTAVEEQARAMGTRIRAMADNLSPNADEVAAGQAVERGITGAGGFLDGFQRASARLYNAFDQSMPAQTAVTPARTLSELGQISSPIAGAPNVSGVVANSKIGQVARAIADDVATNGGTLPYESLKQLRSWVGRQLATSELVSELPRAQLKRIYGALSDDMRNAAAAQGPGSLRAFERANRHYQAGIERIDNHLERLTKVGAEPERIFEALWRGREGETFLTQVRRSIPTHEWRTVAATAVRRLGEATDSAQNAAGTVFSPETFLTRWNQLSPGARQSLFGGLGTMRQDLDAIARAAERIRGQAGILRNASGTAPATIATGTALTATGMGLSGNVGGLAVLGSGMLFNNLTARMMTSPRFVRWLAQGASSHPRYMPAMVAQIGAVAAQEPELREDLARYVDGLSAPSAAQPNTEPQPRS